MPIVDFKMGPRQKTNEANPEDWQADEEVCATIRLVWRQSRDDNFAPVSISSFSGLRRFRFTSWFWPNWALIMTLLAVYFSLMMVV